MEKDFYRHVITFTDGDVATLFLEKSIMSRTLPLTSMTTYHHVVTFTYDSLYPLSEDVKTDLIFYPEIALKLYDIRFTNYGHTRVGQE